MFSTHELMHTLNDHHAQEFFGAAGRPVLTSPRDETRRDVLDSAVQHLRDAGLRITELAGSVDGDTNLDALLEISGPAGAETYAAHVKSRVTPGSAATIQPSARERILIVAPYIPESVGDSLRRQGIHYVDVAGNAYLRWDGLLVDVRGRRQPKAPRPGDPGKPLRAFKANGVKILFVLLADPSIISTNFRNIAHASGTSLGTVQWVLKELEGAGYVSTDGVRKLHRRKDLFNRWVEAYTLDLYPRLTIAKFDTQDATWWVNADEAIRATDSQWSGETAVRSSYPRLRPSRALVYASTVPNGLATEYRFRKAQGPGNVEVRRRFWTLRSDPPDIVVPSPLVYADLIASGDPRQLEAAAHLREHDDLLRRLDRS